MLLPSALGVWMRYGLAEIDKIQPSSLHKAVTQRSGIHDPGRKGTQACTVALAVARRPYKLVAEIARHQRCRTASRASHLKEA